MTQHAAPGTESPMTPIEPVRVSVTVHAPKDRAFEVFTNRMTAWWPPSYKIGRAELAEAVLERRAGGRWYERDTDGAECEWGRLVVYEPPDRLVLTWQIDATWAYNPELVTEVEVRFTEEEPGRTRVELEHRNLDRHGDGWEAARAGVGSEGGWALYLSRFAERVAEQA